MRHFCLNFFFLNIYIFKWRIHSKCTCMYAGIYVGLWCARTVYVGPVCVYAGIHTQIKIMHIVCVIYIHLCMDNLIEHYVWCIYVYTYIYIHIYICIYIYTYTYVYMYVYITLYVIHIKSIHIMHMYYIVCMLWVHIKECTHVYIWHRHAVRGINGIRGI